MAQENLEIVGRVLRRYSDQDIDGLLAERGCGGQDRLLGVGRLYGVRRESEGVMLTWDKIGDKSIRVDTSKTGRVRRGEDWAARAKVHPQSVLKIERRSKDPEPTRGLEPRTPSLRVKCSTS